MVSENLILRAQNGEFREEVRHLILQSHHRWLDAEEMETIFRYCRSLPESDFTTTEESGFFHWRGLTFSDDHEWEPFPNGRRLRSGYLRRDGVIWFSYTTARSPNLLRRTIRFRERYGNHTFVHYLHG